MRDVALHVGQVGVLDVPRARPEQVPADDGRDDALPLPAAEAAAAVAGGAGGVRAVDARARLALAAQRPPRGQHALRGRGAPPRSAAGPPAPGQRRAGGEQRARGAGQPAPGAAAPGLITARRALAKLARPARRPRRNRRCASRAARGGADERDRRVVHLVAAVGLEGPLHGDARLGGARVVPPLRTGVELLGVLGQARRRVLLRVDGDRHEVHLVALGAQLGLQLREDLAHHGADGRAGGEDEVEHDRAAVIELARGATRSCRRRARADVG